MAYLSMMDYETSSEEVKAEFDDQIAKHGRITNMKKTLLHSVPAFKAYMEWYTLFDLIVPFTGERPLILFSYAISTSNECMICSLFFRKILVDSGDDPDNPNLTEIEKLLMDLGRKIATDPHNIPSEMYDALKKHFNEDQIVLLLSFAGIMYATNLFNTIAKVPLDEVLVNYK